MQVGFVKDFFFNRLPPLLPPEHMADFETISVMYVGFLWILYCRLYVALVCSEYQYRYRISSWPDTR
jgi:hypothetical protein